MIGQDERIKEEVQRAAFGMGMVGIDCTVEDGRVLLEGVVPSDEVAYQLEAAVRSVAGVRGVSNKLTVEGFEATVESVAEGIDLSEDFTSEVGTSDYMEAASEAEPYTPPTDPVVKSDRSTDGVEIVNGFAESATEDAATAGLPGLPRGDDELLQAVMAALHSDAATTDLALQIEVLDGVVFLRGVVPSLDDVDAAESIAAEVPGVEEVREELAIEGM
jgi:osmotically-inducible protein OsmY